MDLPKCRTCGERHRLGPCPAFTSSDGGVEGHAATSGVVRRKEQKTPRRASIQPPKARPSEYEANTSPAGIEPGPSEAKPKRAPRGSFDRTAYQRELMRKRRAAQKASAS